MSMTPHPPADEPGLLSTLREEFLADARDRIEAMETALEGARCDRGEAPLLGVRRDAHSLKGTGGAFGFPAISVIAHRLEDYLAPLAELSPRNTGDVQVFLDELRAILAAGHEPVPENLNAILRRLPAHPEPPEITVELRDVEVLLVVPSQPVRIALTRELWACGFRVSTARTVGEAIDLVLLAKPDLVITSVILPQADGIDLVRAVRTMAATTSVRTAILTSFGSKEPALRRLPADVPIIRLGPALSDDLAGVCTSFDIG
jgi:Response regulator containing CheY-like receiver domain and AraC-type DNA-binding domain